ncbi:hypothetical protein GCM10025779_26240 [Arthrobacter cryoconiti]
MKATAASNSGNQSAAFPLHPKPTPLPPEKVVTLGKKKWEWNSPPACMFTASIPTS